jgi:hypothetical protein
VVAVISVSTTRAVSGNMCQLDAFRPCVIGQACHTRSRFKEGVTSTISDVRDLKPFLMPSPTVCEGLIFPYKDLPSEKLPAGSR